MPCATGKREWALSGFSHEEAYKVSLNAHNRTFIDRAKVDGLRKNEREREKEGECVHVRIVRLRN
jgi:hypothetical protein